jgi:hypothetical protein
VCHRASVTLGSIARNDPGRGNKIGLIQRLRLASLWFIDSQAREQPTWDNIQNFIYAPRGPAAPPSQSQPTHNRLQTALGTKSRTHDRRWWKLEGRLHLEARPHLLAGHCTSRSPTSTPSCSHRPIGATSVIPLHCYGQLKDRAHKKLT